MIIFSWINVIWRWGEQGLAWRKNWVRFSLGWVSPRTSWVRTGHPKAPDCTPNWIHGPVHSPSFHHHILWGEIGTLFCLGTHLCSLGETITCSTGNYCSVKCSVWAEMENVPSSWQHVQYANYGRNTGPNDRELTPVYLLFWQACTNMFQWNGANLELKQGCIGRNLFHFIYVLLPIKHDCVLWSLLKKTI